MLFFSASVLAEPATEPSIVIEAAPPVIKREMYDRFHKNPHMPTTKPGEAALTQSDYECSASVRYELTQQTRVGDHWHVVAHIASVDLRTSLVDTIFLPQLAPVELRAHEEGHRKMNEQVYADGEAMARKAATAMLQQDWEGDGSDADAAGKAATDQAVRELCNEYLRHTAQRASDLGDIYDKLTNHGRNALIVANAIRLSFAEEAKIAATQPATTQIDLRS